MSINREELKSEFLMCERNSKVEFVILGDPIKVERVADSGKKYVQYEFQVESNKDKLKYRVFKSDYARMVREADEKAKKKVDSLVGSLWRITRVFADDKDEYKRELLKV
jgi:endonuclease YncB( thermonuclease family)